MMSETLDEWSASRPGMWRAGRDHATHAMTPIAQHLFTTAQPPALRKLFAQWGVVADTLDVEFIHGHYFTRLRPLVGADKPTRRPPPAAVLRVLCRVHPEMRRRNRQAGHTLRTRPWRATIAEWSTSTRPEWERRNLALQDVDFEQLDDPGVADHLERVVAHAVEALHTHFVLHGSDLGPIGMLIVFCEERDIPIDHVVRALRGASPSSSAPARHLAEIRQVVAESGAEPATLDELRAITPLVDQYLRLQGCRVMSGYDITSMTLGEAPAVVLATVLNGRQLDDVATDEQTRSALQAAVPTTDREELDQLLAEARSCMDMRDDNGPYLVEWPFGLVRLAVLEAGRRLVARGSIAEREDALELTHHEIAALLRGLTSDPDAAAVRARAADRQRRSLMIPPDIVGTPEPPPPDGVLQRRPSGSSR
jgi:rifampicin phosphotransferase